MADVYVNGGLLGSVRDDLTECPEDAIWHRALGEIFKMGVKAGRLADVGEVEVLNISEPY